MNSVPALNSSAFKARFIDTMQRSIVQHLDELEAENSEVFHYRGKDLRPAIEKKLYFRCLHDQQRMKAFHWTLQTDGEARVQIAPAVPSLFSQRFRHLVRLLLKPVSKKRAPSPSPLIVFASTEKHLRFAERVLDGCTYEAFSFDPKITPAKCLANYIGGSLPQLRNCSNYLITAHYDLLVEFELITRVIQISGAKQIVLIEGNTAHDCLFSIAAAGQAETVCLQYGWAFLQHLGFQNLPHQKMLTWGQAFSGALKPTNGNITFVETGHPLLETSKDQPDTTKDTVLIIMQAPVGWIGQDSFDAFVRAIQSVAERLPETPFMVRQHPSWPLSNEARSMLTSPNLEISDPYQTPLDTQLARAICTITIYSSVAFEAQLAGSIPIFALLDMDLEIAPDMVSEGLAEKANTEEELYRCVKRLVEDHDRTQAFRDAFESQRHRYFAQGGLESVRKIQQQLQHS